MAENKMREVAALLGVEIGEEFCVNGRPDVYKITQDGLEAAGSGKCWCINNALLPFLIMGEFEIKKKLWKPSNEESYYIPCFSFRGCIDVGRYESDDNELMLYLYEKGFVCKTAEEAKELHDWIVAQVKRHRGIE